MASQSLVRRSVLKNEALYMRDCPRLCIRSATVGLPAYLRFVKRSGQVSTCHRHAWLLRIILFSLLYLLAEWRKLNVKFQCFWLEFNAPHNSHTSLRFCPIILQRTRKKKNLHTEIWPSRSFEPSCLLEAWERDWTRNTQKQDEHRLQLMVYCDRAQLAPKQ